MKGISGVVASILLILIFLSLVGVGYIYFYEMIKSRWNIIECFDGFCKEGKNCDDVKIKIPRSIAQEWGIEENLTDCELKIEDTHGVDVYYYDCGVVHVDCDECRNSITKEKMEC